MLSNRILSKSDDGGFLLVDSGLHVDKDIDWCSFGTCSYLQSSAEGNLKVLAVLIFLFGKDIGNEKHLRWYHD